MKSFIQLLVFILATCIVGGVLAIEDAPTTEDKIEKRKATRLAVQQCFATNDTGATFDRTAFAACIKAIEMAKEHKRAVLGVENDENDVLAAFDRSWLETAEPELLPEHRKSWFHQHLIAILILSLLFILSAGGAGYYWFYVKRRRQLLQQKGSEKNDEENGNTSEQMPAKSQSGLGSLDSSV